MWKIAPSGGELSVADEARPGVEPMPEDDGFDRGGVIGRGGMGTVERARERPLGRDVALKTARLGDPSASARLLREAAITARLDHPGIVPVYRVGRHADGTPFYTMRLLGGRSLHDAVTAARSGEERLGLVHHVLYAAGAIAYANRQGVLHRDLKPSNIMVGDLGETVVADWGLALPQDQWAEGGRVGTVPYMSPEQRAGEPVDERADVYGLGAVLFEVVTGEPPPMDHQDQPRALSTCPPELVAIVLRALAPDRAARYPTAAALAADLSAWFQGRRVSAYNYGALEVARRFVRAWRPLLLAAATGLFAVSIAVGMGWWNTSVERDRALAATAEARHNLGTALIGAARASAERERSLDALAAAVMALSIGPSPDARGILARFGGRPLPRRTAMYTWSCRGVILDAVAGIAGCSDGERLRLVDLRDETVLGDIPARFQTAAMAGGLVGFGGPDEGFMMWDGQRPPWPVERELTRTRGAAIDLGGTRLAMITSDGLVVADRAGTPILHVPRCAPNSSVEEPAFGADGTLFVACATGMVARVAPDGSLEAIDRIEASYGTPVAIATDPTQVDRLAVGTSRGHVVVYADGQRVAVAGPLSNEPTQLEIRGDRIAAVAGLNEAVVWSLGSRRALFRRAARSAAVGWATDGQLVIADTDGVHRWLVPEEAPPHRHDVGAGVAALAVAAGGRWAAGLGDGTVLVRRTRDGAEEYRSRIHDSVAKDVSFHASAQRLAFVHAGHPDAHALDLGSGVAEALPGLGQARRISWVGDEPWAARYAPGLLRAGAGGALAVRPEQFVDFRTRDGGATGWAFDTNEDVWWMAHGELRKIAHFPNARRLYAQRDGVLLLRQWDVTRVGLTGKVDAVDELVNEGVDITASPVGDLYAIGYMAAPVAIRRVGQPEPLARLEGHSGRIGAMSFSPDGRWLWTGGWDGTVRLWSLDQLEMPATALRADVEAALGETVEQRVERVGRHVVAP